MAQMVLPPIDLISEFAKFTEEWLAENAPKVNFTLTVDPFIKLSNVRMLVSSMYCDSLHKGSYWRVAVPLVEVNTADIRGVLYRTLDRGLRDLQAHMAGDFKCDLHILAQELDEGHDDSSVYCMRCGKHWNCVVPAVVSNVGPAECFPLEGAARLTPKEVVHE